MMPGISLLLAFAAGPIAAQDTSAATDADRAHEAIVQEYEAAEKAFYDALDAAKTDDERKEVARTKRPDDTAFAARFRRVADDHPRTEAAARSLVWVVLHARGEAPAEGTLDALLRDHLESPALADACHELSFDNGAETGRVLRRIAAEARSPASRGRALYALSNHLGRVLRLALRMRDGADPVARDAQRKAWDPARLAELDALEPASVEKEIETILERVAADHGDLPMYDRTLGEVAQGDLYEIRNLSIGKTAPDIRGPDIHGVEFKLSDYRGKVVVLDFWGNW